MNRTELEKAAAKLAEADFDRQRAMTQVASEVLRARAQGTPITEIAKQAGLSRPTIYAILGRNR